MSTLSYAASRLGSAVIVLVLSACSEPGPDGDGVVLSLDRCSDEPALACGTLDVPLLYGTRDSPRVLLDLARLPGTGVGPHDVLLFVSDGPGESGTALLRDRVARDALPAALRERYDVVAFDARGVGASDRVDCDRVGLAALRDRPFDRGALDGLVARTSRVAEACSAEYGRRLRWLGSHSTVQDMDALRQALDVPVLNLLAFGYGTRPAALYLETYPRSAGRVVLDASLPPGGGLASVVAERAATRQRALDRLLHGCRAVQPHCDPDVLGVALEARVRAVPDGAHESARAALAAVMLAAVDSTSVGELVLPTLVDLALNGDAAPVTVLARTIASMSGDAVRNAAVPTVERATLCADDAVRPDADDLRDALVALEGTSVVFADAAVSVLASCAGWPAAIVPTRPIRARSAPPALVVAGTGDARFPTAWGRAMAQAVGGELLVSDHDGHAVVFDGASGCVDAVALDFLLDAAAPEGSGCTDDAGAEEDR